MPRIFAALDLPRPVRARLVSWGERELRDPALRRTRPESLHITLCFLGERSEQEAGRAAALVESLTATSFPVRLSGLVAKPARRPAFYAVEAASAELVALQAELAGMLVAAGVGEAEGRPFWPHLTLARVRGEPRRRSRPRRVRRPPGELPAELGEPWEAVRVALYRSKLRPEGAQYVPLATKRLE